MSTTSQRYKTFLLKGVVHFITYKIYAVLDVYVWSSKTLKHYWASHPILVKLYALFDNFFIIEVVLFDTRNA